jgi:hypothetical protein
MDFLFRLRQFRSSAKPTPSRYAILVGAEEADDVDFPEANIVESWEQPDGSVMMIVESQNDLSASAARVPGVRGIEKM